MAITIIVGISDVGDAVALGIGQAGVLDPNACAGANADAIPFGDIDDDPEHRIMRRVGGDAQKQVEATTVAKREVAHREADRGAIRQAQTRVKRQCQHDLDHRAPVRPVSLR